MVEFRISDNRSIKIYLPCKKEELKWFTEISIKYQKKDIEIDIYYNDFVCEAMETLLNLLDKAIEGKLEIEKEFVEKGIGFYYNIYTNKLRTSGNLDVEDPAGKFSMWSTPTHIGFGTYMYNKKNEIYIEISPYYKWHTGCPEDETESYVTFEQFLSGYKAVDIMKIDKDTAVLWKNECQEILDIAARNGLY